MGWRASSHAKYDCKYHLIWCPKRRRRLAEADVRAFVTETFQTIAEEFGFWIEELAVEADHVHVFLEFPRLFPSHRTVGILKSISASRTYPAIPRPPPEVLVRRTMGGRLRGAHRRPPCDCRSDQALHSAARRRAGHQAAGDSSRISLAEARPSGGEGHLWAVTQARGLRACAPGARTTRETPMAATASGLAHLMDRLPRIGIVHAVYQRVSFQ